MKTKLDSFLLTGLKLVAALALVFGLTDTNNAMATSQFAKFQTGFTWADSGGSSLWGAATGGPYTATWTAGNDAVWETTAGSVTVNGATAQNITFNITGMTLAAGSGSLTLNGTTPTVSIASGSATISASLAGSAGLIKTGSGALTFGATSNSFTGGLTIKSGTLTAGNNRYVLGGNAGTGPVTLGDAAGGPATLVFNWNTYNNPITLGASAVGPLTLTDVGTANPLVAGGINLNGNNLNILKSGGNGANSALSIQTTAITGAGSLTLSNMNTAGNGTITISAPVGFTGAITNIGIGTNATLISGIISNTVTAVVQNSATAPLRLNNVGNSAFTGPITVNQGVLKTGNDAAVGLNGVLGSFSAVRQITVASGATLAFGNHDTFGGWANTPAVTLAINGTVTNSAGLGYVNALGPVTFNGGTLAASAGFASTGVYTNIAYALWSGGQVTVSGASTIALSGGAWLALQGIVPFSVAGGASLNVKGPLGNSPLPAAGGLSLSGGGTMMLQGTNTYTNTTTINAGTLLVNGSLAADSAVTVDGTASGILGGSGTINGTVTLQNGGALQPSTSGGVNTLTLANATAPSYGTGSKLTMRSSGTSLDRVTCSAAAAHSLANMDLTIDCSGLSSPVSGATIYSVASGDMSGTAFNSVTLANNLGGYTGTLHYNANGTVTVDLSAATYTVTYNANGGTGSQTDGNAYASGATVTVLGAGTMALANHTLIGWTNDGGTFYRPGGTFSMPANNVTLHAQWTTNNAGTGFNQTTAGWWDYNTTTNWVSDIINGTWDGALTLATNQTVTFATPTTLTTPLSFNYAGNYSLALKGVTAGTETLTLGGDISLNTSGGTNANVSIGDPVNHLNVALGATRILTVAANRTLTFSDPISGAGSGLIKAGGGTLVLGSTNAFTGGLIIKSGTVATRNIGNKTLGGSGTGAITLGDAAGGPATLLFSWQQYNNPITLGTNAVGPLTIGDTMEYTAGGNPGVSGGINLNGNNLNVYNAPGRDKSFTINNAAITGTGSLTLNNANNNGSGSISIPANLGFTGAITNIGIGTNATLISGSFSNSVSAVVQNSATAPLSLSGNNNFGGTALVNAGTLILGTNALGTNATVTVASGATVNLNFSASVTNTIAGLVLNGSTAAAGVHNAATDPTYLTGTGNLLIPSGVANYSTNITFSVSGGGTLTLTWPATHLGWYAQSNSVDLSVATNWHDIPGSQLGTNVTGTVDPTQPKMFYRLSNTSRP